MPFRFRLSEAGCSVLLLAVALGAQQAAPAPSATDAHAQQLLAEARAAAGSASGLQNLKSLEVDYSQRRLASMPTGGANGEGRGGGGPVNEISSDVKVQFLFPDDFRIDETVDLPVGMMGGGDLTVAMGLHGGQGWVKREGGSFAGFRRGGGAGGPDGGQDGEGTGRNPQAAAQREQMMTRRLKADKLRDLLMLTLWAPDSDGLQWQYVGEAHAHDGSADVVDVHGPDNFTARLFLDQKTHRLLVMSYRDVIPFSGGSFQGRRRGMQGGPGQPGANGPGAGAQRPQLANRPRQAPPLQDIELHFSDFRSEHGLMMPHQMVATVHGKPFEQWKLEKVKWNPGNIRPANFEKPAK